MGKGTLQHALKNLPHMVWWAVALAFLWFIASFAYVAFSNLGFSYDLEWMEGAVVQHVARVLEGKPLYARPSLDFASFIYTPLYYYVSAFFSLFTGADFTIPRLVSIFSVFFTCGLIYRFVQHEAVNKAESRPWALVAAGLYAAAYPVTGLWMDMARVDALQVFLLLLSLYLIRTRSGTSDMVLAGAVSAAAILTKQVSCMALLPVCLWMACYRFKDALWLGTSMVVFTAIPSLWLNLSTDGWFFYYIFQLPRQHRVWDNTMFIWNEDLKLYRLPALLAMLGLLVLGLKGLQRQWQLLALGVVGALCAALYGHRLAALWFFFPWLASQALMRYERRERLFFVALFAGGVWSAYTGRSHEGGLSNTLMHYTACVSLLTGLYARELFAFAAPLIRREGMLLLQAGVLAFCGMQLEYNPKPLVPDAKTEPYMDHLWEAVHSLPAKKAYLFSGFVPSRYGEGTQAHYVALRDVVRGRHEQVFKQMLRDVRGKLKTYDMMIVGDFRHAWLRIDPYRSMAKAGGFVKWLVIKDFPVVRGSNQNAPVIFYAKKDWLEKHPNAHKAFEGFTFTLEKTSEKTPAASAKAPGTSSRASVKHN